jgi:hypothetical protein
MGGVRRLFSVRSWYPFGVVIVLHENQTGEFNLESAVEHGFVGNLGVVNHKRSSSFRRMLESRRIWYPRLQTLLSRFHYLMSDVSGQLRNLGLANKSVARNNVHNKGIMSVTEADVFSFQMLTVLVSLFRLKEMT